MGSEIALTEEELVSLYKTIMSQNPYNEMSASRKRENEAIILDFIATVFEMKEREKNAYDA